MLLLRDSPRGVEALLVRRHAAMAFLGGAWVFPGGKLDPADRSAEALGRVPPAARARCEAWASRPGRPCTAEEAVGLYVAACRETFEEAGVLLARGEDGAPCPPDRVERLLAERDAVARRATAFVGMLARERLALVEDLIPWAHWVTPSQERIRFDARFFAARVPENQRVLLDDRESTDHAWTRPADAVAAWDRGALVMAAPTLATLSEAAASAARHRTAAAVIAGEEGRGIAPILPRLRHEGDAVVALMPWDPDYAAAEGEGTGPDLEIPEALRALPSRLPLPHVERRIVHAPARVGSGPSSRDDGEDGSGR